MNYPKYLYEHTNGKIIEKVAYVCEYNTTPEEYFESPFVKRYARINNEKEEKEFLEKT
jgi:hypothetical protein